MRATVIAFNVLSAILGLLCLPLARLFGGLGILFLAYNKPGETVLGLAIAAIPILLPVASIVLSQYLLKRKSVASVLIAALPVAVALVFVATQFA